MKARLATQDSSVLTFQAARPELCLDYANTRCWRGTDSPEESLQTAADLLDWIRRSGSVPDELTTAMSVMSDADQVRLLGDAIMLREAIYSAFSAVAMEQAPSEADLDVLNTALGSTPARTRLAQQAGVFTWSSALQQVSDPAAPVLLAPVLWSAADLLVQGQSHRIRRCANDRCRWLFVDRSKAGTRRWCDMGSCGNRAKSQRHYARLKGS